MSNIAKDPSLRNSYIVTGLFFDVNSAHERAFFLAVQRRKGAYTYAW